MNKNLRTLALYGTLTAAVVGTGGLAFGALGNSSGASTSTATRLVSASLGTVASTVSSSGTVAPGTSLDLNFDETGTLLALYVGNGDSVKAGQLLAEIDPTQAKADLATAQAGLMAAKDKLADAKTGLTAVEKAQADAALSSAQQKVDTATKALASATPENQAQAQANLTDAQAALEVVKLQNAEKAAVSPSAVAQAQAAVDQATIGVTKAEKALAATKLTAPIAGTVTGLDAEVGDTVGGVSGAGASTPSAFLTVVDLSKMVVEVSFTESDTTDLAEGQAATVTVDSLPGESATGTLSQLDTTSTVVSNVVTYGGTVALDEVPEGLKPGMTANVTVTTASKSQVIAIPSAAVTSRGGQSTVTVRTAAGDETRTVTTGLKGDGTTEITSGLQPGDQVVLSVGTVSAGTGQTSGQPTGRTGSFTGPGGGGFTGPPPGGF